MRFCTYSESLGLGLFCYTWIIYRDGNIKKEKSIINFEIDSNVCFSNIFKKQKKKNLSHLKTFFKDKLSVSGWEFYAKLQPPHKLWRAKIFKPAKQSASSTLTLVWCNHLTTEWFVALNWQWLSRPCIHLKNVKLSGLWKYHRSTILL